MAKKKASKRNIFAELMDGVGDMRAHREGRLTLRTHRVESKPLPWMVRAKVPCLQPAVRAWRDRAKAFSWNRPSNLPHKTREEPALSEPSETRESERSGATAD